jgi:hypothetical protein
MPIVSGGVSSGGGGALTKISDSTLGSPAASFDLTAIAATYNHLMLLLYVKDDGAVINSWVNLRFNNDSAANYDREQAAATGNSNSPAGNAAATSMQVLFSAGTTGATAQAFGAGCLVLPNYTGTTGYKAVTTMTGAIGLVGTITNYLSGTYQGLWRSTAAITRITLLPGNGSNFVAGSRVSLYGIT